ncbi:hypothetical protein [Nostoc sp. NMS8]|uniref:hypothetical protein n=1 Tax=Nostoc sp. NMS8 TaxID=2815392 RepID=UPI0025CFA829|nr:hypothetical protein [Nostoc sp. NMS8]MBN3961815.1 hypothetical protein [Nostoc sp. NMS8]
MDNDNKEACEPQAKTEIPNELEKRFPLGYWVRTEGCLAQIVGYWGCEHQYLQLDGRDKSILFGSYRITRCYLLSRTEMLQLGLSIALPKEE